jgi:DNA-binding transcriptional LysR family regulator
MGTIDELDAVSTFARVIDAGSMSAAASALGVPKSTVSRRVARLEESLGVRLLQRTTRRMTLTEAGAIFLDRVGPALSAIDEAADAARDVLTEPRGLVRMTAPGDLGTTYLGPILAEFARANPLVEVYVDVSGRIVDLAREGFDLALRAAASIDPSLVARPLAKDETGLYASPAYLAARAVPRHPRDLTDHDHVLFRPSGASTALRLFGPEGAEEIVMVGGRLGTNEFSLLRELLMQGLGIGFLPAAVAAPPLENGALARVLPDWSGPSGTLYLCHPAGRYLPAKVRVLRDFLATRFSPPPWHLTCEQARKVATSSTAVERREKPAAAKKKPAPKVTRLGRRL